ncbi:hypothetical protein BGZ51_008418 [Haplosporangium sp. Z 767]|nr:hypothetical protein BGZ51_008418 [Haplosporangium sp. Z 767]
MATIPVRWLKLDRFEPNRIVTSNIVSVSTLVIIRAFEFLYVMIAMFTVWATSKSAADYLQYFTNLTYFGLASYLCASMVWGILYLRVPEPDRATWVRSGSPWWGYAHWLLYSTVVTFSTVVPLVFWTLLATGVSEWSAVEIYTNISVHALDGVFGALIELIFNRHFLQPVHSLFVAGVMVLYMCLTFVVHETMGTWVYHFLDWDQGPKAAIYYIGVAIGLFIIFFVLFALHNTRNKCLAERSIRINGDLDMEYRQHPQSEKDDLENGRAVNL